MNKFEIKDTPKISVVVPVKNESEKIKACLDGILSQTIPVSEIIIIDSGSTDGTQEIVSAYSEVILVEIDPNDFNHGETRNIGAKIAIGEYILYTVGDARPFDENWIEFLLNGFTNESVAGVCGLQVVAHDKETNPIDWFKPITDNPQMTSYYYQKKEAFEALTPSDKRMACSWDNVSAMYRKDILKKIPFIKTVYGEDTYWAMEALKSGYALTYNPRSRVYHYHSEDYSTTFKRTIAVCYLRYVAFGDKPGQVDFFKTVFFRVLRILRERGVAWPNKYRWIKYNIQSVRALSMSVKLFLGGISRGEEGLNILYKEYCGTPPAPIKKNKL